MKLTVDQAQRYAKMRAHTVTHLLHAQLEKLLKNTKQAGSMVDEDITRFDFQTDRLLTSQEISAIEKNINLIIYQGLTVSKQEMSYNDAIKLGAKAFFEDKYGDLVRVIMIKRISDDNDDVGGGKKFNDPLTEKIIKLAYEVHNELGPKQKEYLYQKAFIRVLEKEGFKVDKEKPIDLKIRNEKIGKSFIDIVVNNTIGIELKSQGFFMKENFKQLRTYIGQSDLIKTGLLIDFGGNKVTIKRLDKDFIFNKSSKIVTDNNKLKIIGHPLKSSDIISIELCGGTHVDNTAEIGCFKIIGQEAVASGVKRLTVITGPKVYEFIQEQEKIFSDLADKLQVKPKQVAEKLEKMLKEFEELKNQNISLQSKIINSELTSLFDYSKGNSTFDKILKIGKDSVLFSMNFKSVVDQARSLFKDQNIVVYNSDGNFAIFTNPGISALEISKNLGIKGGGNAGLVQGRDSEIEGKII